MATSSATTASERLISGLTLHRSEVIAHTVDLLNSKGGTRARALARRRRGGGQKNGRYEGFDTRPLGNLLAQNRISEINASKLAKVEKSYATVMQNVAGHHHEAKPKRASEKERTERAGTDDEQDGDAQKQDKALSADRLRQQLPSLPRGLFGADLPRCHGHHQVTNGFNILQRSVRGSESRLQQVKTDASNTVCGLDYKASMLDCLMPHRERYPPTPRDQRVKSVFTSSSCSSSEIVSDGPLSDNRTIKSGALSARAVLETKRGTVAAPTSPFLGSQQARAPKHSPRQPATASNFRRDLAASSSPEKRPRPFPIQLPSLADYIASSGGPVPGMLLGGRNERDEVRQREQINELFGLPKNTLLKLSQEERDGPRRGRTDIKRRIEKQLDTVWGDRSFWKRCNTVPRDLDVQELRRRCHGDDVKLATVDRFLRELTSLHEEARGGKEEAERAVGSMAADASGGAAGAERPTDGGGEGGDRRRQWEEDEDVAHPEEAEEAVVRTRNHLRRSADAVAQLRSALNAYQALRDEKKDELLNTTLTMDKERPNLLRWKAANMQEWVKSDWKKTTKGSPTQGAESEGEERMQRQHQWYRDLLTRVQGDRRLPSVVHFIFDFIRQVLEYGEEFRKDLYYVMLREIEDSECTKVVSNLVVNMIRGIDDLTTQDLVTWFEQNRGGLPRHIKELLECKSGTELTDVEESPGGDSGKQISRTLTFVTEMP